MFTGFLDVYLCKKEAEKRKFKLLIKKITSNFICTNRTACAFLLNFICLDNKKVNSTIV